MELLYVVIGLVVIFDFINGFHDSANSIATIVSTKVLKPATAVVLAAFFNFIAYAIFSTKVASTMGKGVVNPDVINLTVITAALVAAITWNLLTWYWGIPSSSSHTLVGGLVGASVMKAGASVIIFSGLFKILAFIVVAPLLGMTLSVLITSFLRTVLRKAAPHKVDKVLKKLQIVSSSMLSLGHGGNDAQKSMGIIWVAMIIAGHVTKDDPLPTWIAITCYVAIAMGTLMGGWRIVKTMGQKITKLRSFDGFSADLSGAMTLFGATEFGIPVSTTHTITGSIIGVGATRGVTAVKWGVTRNIFWAWILTIPVSALIGATSFLLLNYILN